jgi:predicted DNA binding protein
MADMATKGRAASGEKQGRATRPERTARGIRSGQAKLTDTDVRIIRSSYAAGGVSLAMLAALFRVSKKTILNVVHGRIWTHVL